jgi:hypothetical protein
VRLVEPVDDARSVWLVEIRVPDEPARRRRNLCDTVKVKLAELVADSVDASIASEGGS